MTVTASNGWADWGAASANYPGEETSGDQYVALESDGALLIAVVDGLGHGESASKSAHEAIEAVREANTLSLSDIMNYCHERIRGTRGVVATLALIERDAGTLTWLGVGNVDATLLRNAAGGAVREVVPSRGGVVGYQLPALVPSVRPIATGDLVVLTTDGLAVDFTDHVTFTDPPLAIAENLVRTCWTGKDDALAVVVRFGWEGQT